MTTKSNIRLAADNEDVAKAAPAPGAEASAPGPSAPPPPAPEPVPSRLKRLRLPLMLGGVLVAVAAAAFFWITGGQFQKTDNAYVRVGSVGVSTNIPGRVTRVHVHENQRVKAGDILFTLDSRPAAVAAEQAAAQLANVRSRLAADQADYRAKQAELRTAEADARFKAGEAARARNLMQAGAVSKSESETAANAAAAARQQVEVVRQQIAALGARLGGGAAGHPEIREARAAIDNAALQGSYTVVRAPQAGIVTKVENLQVGDYVNASQRVFALVTDSIWVEAAFKENQLNFMRPGQTATVRVDAYPGHEFTARIESIAPGTDQTFSVLPAENASGNWVKVVQRVPVRLVFTKKPDITLQGGLSAEVKVDTQHHRLGGAGSR